MRFDKAPFFGEVNDTIASTNNALGNFDKGVEIMSDDIVFDHQRSTESEPKP